MAHYSRPIALAVALALALSAVGGVAAAGPASAAAAATPAGEAATGAHALSADDERHEPNETRETTITVSAVGQAETGPDRAVVLLGSTAIADDPATATARLAANASRLRAALLAANLGRERFRTTDYDVFEQRVERPDARPGNETVRYVARQGFEVTLDDLNRTGEIVDLAVASGATEVRGVSFALSEETRRALREQALGEAMTDARRQAGAIAAAANLTVAGVASVSSGGQEFVPFRGQAFEEAATTADTRIDSGPVSVTATVQVTYVADGAAAAAVAAGNETG